MGEPGGGEGSHLFCKPVGDGGGMANGSKGGRGGVTGTTKPVGHWPICSPKRFPIARVRGAEVKFRFLNFLRGGTLRDRAGGGGDWVDELKKKKNPFSRGPAPQGDKHPYVQKGLAEPENHDISEGERLEAFFTGGNGLKRQGNYSTGLGGRLFFL